MPITQNDTDDAMEVTGVSGLILLSPTGTKYRVYVTDQGVLQVHSLDGYRRLRDESA